MTGKAVASSMKWLSIEAEYIARSTHGVKWLPFAEGKPVVVWLLYVSVWSSSSQWRLFALALLQPVAAFADVA